MDIKYFIARPQQTTQIQKKEETNIQISQQNNINFKKHTQSNKILICIFNYQYDNNAKRWLNLLSPYFDTVVLDSGKMHNESLFIQFDNIYYSGLWNEMKKLYEKGNYKWVGIITSDVKIDDENANKLIKELYHLQNSINIGCWTVLGDPTGHYNRYVYALYNNQYYRTFEGFFMFINKNVLDEQPYVDTNINKYGYGLDFLSCYISNKNGLVNIVNEDIKIFHPKNKGYNASEAAYQSKQYCKYLQTIYPKYKISAKEFPNIIKEYEKIPIYIKEQKKCIYTCISGNYDTLRDPKVITDGWDYICFTDQNITSDIWEIRKIPDDLQQYSQVKRQRLLKILSYKYLSEYDIVIWTDANVQQIGNLDDFSNEVLLNNDIAFKLHPTRNCTYAECNACLRYKKESKEICDALKSRYEKEGLPKQFGIYETNTFIRNNKSDDVKKLMDLWAKELIENSHRDQLSLNYCIWKLNMKDKIDEFSNTTFKKYFKLLNHQKLS